MKSHPENYVMNRSRSALSGVIVSLLLVVIGITVTSLVASFSFGVIWTYGGLGTHVLPALQRGFFEPGDYTGALTESPGGLVLLVQGVYQAWNLLSNLTHRSVLSD